MNKDIIALSLLAGGEAAHAFSAHLPSHFTIKSFALDDKNGDVAQKVADLRSGYLPASVFGIAMGALVSYLAKSPLPLMASVGTTALMIVNYESALPPEMRLGALKQITG